ncbi:helix-turn-helix domain-containing protein [Streptomyces caniferus]|uniref:AraC family transcriptional regulator n=1 Tax=Streptomyces caniferus TaxID=285557 RepID=A0A640SI92_9ACTN|nr:helix-turn-helix domain-containing protein [Streptomyces caniferus]GFE11139.1 AraC family transcriptional regulator [Streptomyces caniferus]
MDEHPLARPAPALRPYVSAYAGYRQAGVPPGRHRGLPSPRLTLIFTLDEPLTLAGHPDPGQAPGTYGALLGGLHTRPALITHQGRQSGIQVGLHPLGARALLGLPAGELASLDLPADVVLGQQGTDVGERLRTARSWTERFALLDDFLLRRLSLGPDGPGAAPEVVRAWRLLAQSRGTATVATLAEDIGWSTRHLTARFRQETGLTPKTAARVIRFDRARRLLGAAARAGTPPPLAHLAVRCGYFDQAHLARDFRSLAGCPPSQWLVEEFRNVQAPGDAIEEC